MPKVLAPEAGDFSQENMQNIFILSWNIISYIKSMSLLIYYVM